MEVIYLGMFQISVSIIKATSDEDVYVVGLSYPSGEHLIFTPKIVEEIKKSNLDDVLLITGGTSSVENIPAMEETGIDRVLRAGSLTETFVKFIKNNTIK